MKNPIDINLEESKYNDIIVRPKASWVGLICCTHQHYQFEEMSPNKG